MVDLVGTVVQRLEYLGVLQADEVFEGRIIFRNLGLEGRYRIA